MSPVSQQSLSLCPWLEKPLEAMSSAPGSQAQCFLCSLGWLELQHRAANPTCFHGEVPHADVAAAGCREGDEWRVMLPGCS